ncbi:MAG: flagellar biosynthetic protein FliO [bacterium]
MEKFNRELAAPSLEQGTQKTTDASARVKFDKSKDQLNLVVITGKIICYLLLITILIVFIARYLKRGINAKARNNHRTNRLVQVLESAFVAPGKTINLVKILDRVLVLGVAQNNISFLTEFDGQGSQRLLQKEAEMQNKGIPAFSQAINQFLKKKNIFR